MKNFFAKYNLKNAVPKDPSFHEVSALDFAVTLENFINEHFLGLAKINYDSSLSGSVTVSPEYSALFLKNLLAYVSAKQFIEISVKERDDELLLHVNLKINEDTELDMRSAIIKSARNAGFDLHLAKDGIILSTKRHKESFTCVYARSTAKDKFIRSLNYIFFG